MEARKQSRFGVRRLYLWACLVAAAVVGAGASALVFASVPHAFMAGETLRAADLNDNFVALDQRLTALEGQDPFAGTYPGVLGLGASEAFCNTPPASLTISGAAPVAPTVTHSDAFGRVVFTNGGALGVLLSAPTPNACAANTVCASPLTFFLKAPATPASQQITVHSFLDNGGAIYLNGAPLAGVAPGNPSTPLGGNPNTTTFTVQAGASFALSFLSCSTDGPSLGLAIYDRFITANNLTVDYDRTFHRNGN